MRYILAFIIGALVGGCVVDQLDERERERQWQIPGTGFRYTHTRSHRLRASNPDARCARIADSPPCGSAPSVLSS